MFEHLKDKETQSNPVKPGQLQTFFCFTKSIKNMNTNIWETEKREVSPFGNLSGTKRYAQRKSQLPPVKLS